MKRSPIWAPASFLCTILRIAPCRPVGRMLAQAMLLMAVMDYIEKSNDADKSYLTKGILGALLGAGLGVGAMFAFYAFAGFRFPLLGVGIGILTGFGAKVLSKGGDATLGYISAGIALAAVVATLYLMYGSFPILSIVSVIVSASFAYRIASS